MKNNYALLLMLVLVTGLLGVPSVAHAQDRDTIRIDFGLPASPAPWNTLADAKSGSLSGLVNSLGNRTIYGISVTDAFNGTNMAGTQSPDPGAGLPASATGDSFFGNTVDFNGVEPTGAVTLTRLTPNKEYTLSIFASRVATDNREATYVAQGATVDSVSLNASGNNGTTVSMTLRPAADSTIVLAAHAGPDNDNSNRFYYLGALVVSYEMEATPPPPPPPPTGPDIADTILVDFGSTTVSPSPWNNITDQNAGSIEDLLNSGGFQTGYGIAIVDSFNSTNTDGTVNPNPELGFPASATGDSFYGNTSEFNSRTEPTAGVELRKLEIGEAYTVELFASRTATDNRETQYIVEGATTDTVYLNVASNTDSVATTTLMPAADGTIRITLSPGPNNTNGSGFYYLGVLRLTYPNKAPVGASALSLLAPNGGEFWQVGKMPNITWEASNLTEVVLDYSTNNGASWTNIDTVPAFLESFAWTVPDTPTESALVRIHADTLMDISDSTFVISSDTSTCTIVVLGSSTAEGTGASTPDSAWVNRYRQSLGSDTRFEVVNLGRGGYTTYHILPTGSQPPAGVDILPDPARNITRALTLDPFAIIINMPSNDANNNYPVGDQLANFATVVNQAEAAGVSVYVATTQPRNFTNTTQVQIQREVRDSIFAIYGDHAVDFWDGLAAENGYILPEYNSGDGIHLNDAGHYILFERVSALRLDTLGCGDITDAVGGPPSPLTGVSVFPNPSPDGRLYVEFSADLKGEVEVQLIDLLGRVRYATTQRLSAGRLNRISLETGRASGSPAEYIFCVITLQGEVGYQRKVNGVLLR